MCFLLTVAITILETGWLSE